MSKVAAVRRLILPGWQGSGPGHWQALWEQIHGDQRVEQGEWHWPRRGDWMTRLEEVLLGDSTPAVVAAHSLGCHLVAAWAAHSRRTSLVRGALLVAPPDLSRRDLPIPLCAWRPAERRRLPFRSVVISSEDDPFSGLEAAHALAEAWGSEFHDIGPRGHVNADSGLGDWPEGRRWLDALCDAAA